ncbi:ATP12 family chaperone protein [Gymnodinialimonas hymeniacidonis]|uniref:ATP12 family chaperone protein n=1 Tax=Gymnodinialimonas hymeniacidonis TaxID=3126508 RepID=UPI0034C6A0A8
MTEWKAKRFWTDVAVRADEGGYRVFLDERTLNTPGKLPLLLPTEAMAEAVAEEWRAQDGHIQPLTMPNTRSANSAIERVAPQHAEVCAMLSAYGETDLLCYRAHGPAELTQRQQDAWDPLLDWATERFAARLVPVAGVLPVDQDPAALGALAAQVSHTEAFPLTALHDLITLTGSLVLGLAIAERHISANEGWRLSRIDEDWQISQWGEDDEATQMAEAKRAQLLHAERFLSLCSEK